MNKNYFSTPIDIKAVAVDDPFWSAFQETVRREVIPYQWEALNDRVEGAAPSYCMHNFRAAAQLMAEKKASPGFQEPVYTDRALRPCPRTPPIQTRTSFLAMCSRTRTFLNGLRPWATL